MNDLKVSLDFAIFFRSFNSCFAEPRRMRTFLLGPQDPSDEVDEVVRRRGGMEEDEGWDEEDMAALKRRSVVQMEANLMEDCDSSPIQPRSITAAEQSGSASQVEKLLVERMMLRKELRLRSMQERLLEQADKLETTETRLKEVEALPGFRSFVWLATTVASARQLGGQGAAGAVEGLARAGRVLRSFFVLLVCRLPLCLLHLLPPGVTIALANLAHHLSSLMATRAENFSNECQERERRGKLVGSKGREGARRRR